MLQKYERQSKVSMRDRFIPSCSSEWQVPHARAMLHARQRPKISLAQQAYHDELSQTIYGFSSNHLYNGSVLGCGQLLPAFARFTPRYRLNSLRVLDITSSLLSSNAVVADVYYNPVFYCDNGDVLYLAGNQMNRFRAGLHNVEYKLVSGVNLVSVAQSIDHRFNYVSTNSGALHILDNATPSTNSVKSCPESTFAYVIEPRCHNTFFIGTNNGKVSLVDLRQQEFGLNYQASQEQRVTSMSFNGVNTIAVGTNLDKLKVYDIRNHKELWQYNGFKAAVMGLSYHPSKPNLLAAGDGVAGKTLTVFRGKRLIASRNTAAQVTGVTWCGRSIFTSHGYSDYSCQLHQLHNSNGKHELKQLAVENKHLHRILGCSARRDRADMESKQVVALGQDHRLSFWRVSSTATKADKENTSRLLNTLR